MFQVFLSGSLLFLHAEGPTGVRMGYNVFKVLCLPCPGGLAMNMAGTSYDYSAAVSIIPRYEHTVMLNGC
jgi:hypothetical protein